MRICVLHGAYEGQKRVLDSLKLELEQDVGNCHADVGR